MQNENQNFKTSDFPLATTLISLGFSVQALDKSNPKRVLFCFISSKEIDKTVEGYWSDNIAISPRKFYFAQKELKSRLYEGIDS